MVWCSQVYDERLNYSVGKYEVSTSPEAIVILVSSLFTTSVLWLQAQRRRCFSGAGSCHPRGNCGMRRVLVPILDKVVLLARAALFPLGGRGALPGQWHVPECVKCWDPPSEGRSRGIWSSSV